MAKNPSPQSDGGGGSNVPPDLIAEALASYTELKAEHERTGMAVARDQARYARQGVDSGLIRRRHMEAKMTMSERTALYAKEHLYRRVCGLWEADSPEDFDRLMSEAAAAQPSPQAIQGLEDARAHVDGYNSAFHGGGKTVDNPHLPGASQHQAWALGWDDGLRERDKGKPLIEPRQAAPDREPTEAGTKRKRGRKPVVFGEVHESVEIRRLQKIAARDPEQSQPAALGWGDGDDMPPPPGLPN